MSLTFIGYLVSVLASGGLTALLLVRRQARSLDAQARHAEVSADVAEVAGEDEHWQAIVLAQTEALVKPLAEQVAALREEVDRLRTETSILRAEIETHRTRYWRAITYIRVLLAWARHPETVAIPAPPAEIAVDI